MVNKKQMQLGSEQFSFKALGPEKSLGVRDSRLHTDLLSTGSGPGFRPLGR